MEPCYLYTTEEIEMNDLHGEITGCVEFFISSTESSIVTNTEDRILSIMKEFLRLSCD